MNNIALINISSKMMKLSTKATEIKKMIEIINCIRDRERSGSVIECLTRDRGVSCSSLSGVTALCP